MLKPGGRIAAIILFIALTLSGAAGVAHASKPRDIDKVKREQQTVKRQLKETSKAITANSKETERNLNRLNRLGADMAETRKNIDRISVGIDSLNSAIASRTDSIKELEGRIDGMKKAYAEALRKAQPYREQTSVMAFIFASESVSQAYRRVRYLRQFSKWRNRKIEELRGAMSELEKRRSSLLALEKQRKDQLAGLTSEHKNLEKQQEQTSALVAKLKSEGAGLRQTLKQREERARALDRELDRLIAEEQARIERERKAAEERRKREAAEKAKKAAAPKNKKGSEAESKADQSKDKAKPASGKDEKPELNSVADEDRKLSGSFAANKGRLLFPVAGKYRVVRTFGRQKHPELQHVETNNSGIDIEVPAGTNARAVFQGTVSAIFRLPGYANIVMVRHGDYISLYANLQDVYVKKGDHVKAGQSVGRIYTDPDDDGRTTFHFELRRERTKLNPLEWVR